MNLNEYVRIQDVIIVQFYLILWTCCYLRKAQGKGEGEVKTLYTVHCKLKYSRMLIEM